MTSPILFSLKIADDFKDNANAMAPLKPANHKKN